MADFSNLKRLDVNRSSVARFQLDMLDGDFWVEGRPANEMNPAYFTDLMKRNADIARRLKNKNLSVELLNKMREDDRVLYAKHVLTGWNVEDSARQPVKFSAEEVASFLKQLPDWIFDDMRNFFRLHENFVMDALSPEDRSAEGEG